LKRFGNTIPPHNKVTKVEDIYYCRSEFTQAGIEAEIFDAVEEGYLSVPITASIYVKSVI
jgi:hypothetical protein